MVSATARTGADMLPSGASTHGVEAVLATRCAVIRKADGLPLVCALHPAQFVWHGGAMPFPPFGSLATAFAALATSALLATPFVVGL